MEVSARAKRFYSLATLVTTVVCLALFMHSPQPATALGVGIGGSDGLLSLDLGKSTPAISAPSVPSAPTAEDLPTAAPELPAVLNQVDPPAPPVTLPDTGIGGTVSGTPAARAPISDGNARTTTTGGNSSAKSGRAAKRSSRRAPSDAGNVRPASAKGGGNTANRAVPARNSGATAGNPSPDNNNSVIIRTVEAIPAWIWAIIAALAAAAVGSAFMWMRSRRNPKQAFEVLAMTDPTTGCANISAFDARLAEEWQLARRFERALGVMMIDLGANKVSGQTAGVADQELMLREAIRILRNSLGSKDFLASTDTGEFAVICPEANTGALLERRGAIEGAFRAESKIASVITIGVAELERFDRDKQAVVDRAHAALDARRRAHDDLILVS